MSILTKEAILNSEDVETRDLHIKEWGGTVRLRSLRGWERDQFEQEVTGGPGKVNARARLCALVLIDEQGNQIFTPGDVKALGQKNASSLEAIFDAALKMNGLAKDSQEELAKNSEEDQSGDSTSYFRSHSGAQSESYSSESEAES